MSTTFDERAEALARANGLSWPLKESELRIDQIHFSSRRKHVARTNSGESLKCRSWLQVLLARRIGSGEVSFNPAEFREETLAYFGPELCAKNQLRIHPFIRGMLQADRAIAYLKVGKRV